MNEKEQKEIFSENLNRFLAIYDKSQKEVADAIGVSPQTFNTWCKGIAIPRMGKVELLSNYFHVPKTGLIDRQVDEIKERYDLEVAHMLMEIKNNPKLRKFVHAYMELPDKMKESIDSVVYNFLDSQNNNL